MEQVMCHLEHDDEESYPAPWAVGSHRGFISKGGTCPDRELGKPREDKS